MICKPLLEDLLCRQGRCVLDSLTVRAEKQKHISGFEFRSPLTGWQWVK